MSTYQSQTARIVLASTRGVTIVNDGGKRESVYGTATLNVTHNHKGTKRSVTIVPQGERKASHRVDVDRVLTLISPSSQDRASFLSHRQ